MNEIVMREALEQIARDEPIAKFIDEIARLRNLARAALAADQPHGGEPHEFRAYCLRCGQPGMVNVSILAPGESIEIARPVK
jgi:hypothetical protein